MKVYLTLNAEIKNLIVDGSLRSNHKSQVWRLLSEQESYVGFTSFHFNIEECSESILSEYLTVGNYLVELDINEEDIIDTLAYSDYLKLSASSTVHTVTQITEVLQRAKRIVNFAPMLAIVFKNLTMQNVKHVYRYSNSGTPWVECEIKDNKLYHKIN